MAYRTWKEYNKVRTLWRFVLQVSMAQQRPTEWSFQLLPTIVIGHNNNCIIAVGFEWLGSVNVGLMTKGFVEAEKKRHADNQKWADKLNLPLKIWEQRWGW